VLALTGKASLKDVSLKVT